ncbi:hypothetical protein Pint_25575 [Pistacia integerrima]|uniref:Uncharacterized protein n=1 Tax=Pistacia integerrima TaxID=434235 RepID=A0ACC0YE88_9ROSI|nr:hypothetical protein Pint_25575 [Pistacia integerrima]
MGSIDAAQVKVDAQQGLDVAGSVNSCEGLIGMGEGKENVHELCVPSHIPVVDHAEVMLQDFKDYKGLKFLQSVTSDSVSSEITKDKKDDVEYPLSVDNCTGFHSVQSSEVTKASASEMNVLEDNLLLEGRMPMVKNLSGEGKSYDHQQILNQELLAGGKHSLQAETTFESCSILHESVVDAGDVVNVSETKLPETKFTNLDGVSTTPDVIKQLEIDGNDNTQGECVAEHGRGVEILDRNSEDHAMKDSLVSPSDTEVSIQSSVAVDYNHAKKLVLFMIASTTKAVATTIETNKKERKEQENGNDCK